MTYYRYRSKTLSRRNDSRRNWSRRNSSRQNRSRRTRHKPLTFRLWQSQNFVMDFAAIREVSRFSSGVGSISWLVRRGHGRATTCELYAKIIAESELLQPALNETHKFCFQHWSRGRGTCGTGSVAPVQPENGSMYAKRSDFQQLRRYFNLLSSRLTPKSGQKWLGVLSEPLNLWTTKVSHFFAIYSTRPLPLQLKRFRCHRTWPPPGQELRGSFRPKDIFSPRSFCPRTKAPTPGWELHPFRSSGPRIIPPAELQS